MTKVNFKTVLVIALIVIVSGNIYAQRGGLPLVPKYWEDYNTRTKELVAKMWSNEKHLRGELFHSNGTKSIMIFRSDSAKAYMIDPEKKTIMEFPTAQIKSFAQVLGETSRTSKEEFIGKETVESYECEHYRTALTTVTNGKTVTTYRDGWWYQPYKMEIKSKEEALDAVVSRNIKLGAQPASLFELPKDYKMINVNAEMDKVKNQMEQLKNMQDMLKEQMQNKK
jgi:hypothetical protein